MHKKMIYSICVAFIAPATISIANTLTDGGDLLLLNVGIIDPTNAEDGNKKSPIQIPLVYQDGNTLTFATPCAGCTVELLDANGDIVYSGTIATGTTLVNLPDASLLGGSGTYELRLVYGSYYFYADITL